MDAELKAKAAKILSHRHFRQITQILVYLGLSRVVTIFATAWASNCLGTHNCGISGMITATLAQMNLVIVLHMDALWIRRYKAAPTERERQELVAIGLTQRVIFSVAFALGGLLVAVALRLPREWWLGVGCAVPLLIFNAVQMQWVFVAREVPSVNYRTTAVISLLSAAAYWLFFRPGQSAGSDIAVLAIAAGVGAVIMLRQSVGSVWRLPIKISHLHELGPLLIEGRWLIICGILIYIYAAFEVPLLGYLCTLSDVGVYSRAYNLANGINQALGLIPIVLYPRILDWQKAGVPYMWNRLKKVSAIASLALLPVIGMVFLVSPLLFHFLYRPEFRGASYPFAILFASRCIEMINVLIGQGLLAQSQERHIFRIIVPTSLISLCLNVAFIPAYGMWAAACINLASQVLFLIGTLILARILLEKPYLNRGNNPPVKS